METIGCGARRLVAGVCLALVAGLVPVAPAGAAVEGTVLGFLPYWEATDGAYLDGIRWELLSDLVYFAVEVDEDGVVTDAHGWGGDTTDRLAAEAELAGVRFGLSVVAEDHRDDVIDAMVTDAGRRAAVIETIVALMAAGRARSVNVDLEHPAEASREGMTAFVEELAEAVRGEWPDAFVSVATPKVYKLAGYDLAALVATADAVMSMSYGYHSDGSARPGPSAPLRCRDGDTRAWYFCIDERTRPVYEQALWPRGLGRVLLGLPFYGYDWPTETAAPCVVEDWPGGCGRGEGSLFTVDMRRDTDPDDWCLGPLGDEPYLPYRSGGGWRQAWVDDAVSFDAKLDYVQRYGYGGVGLWALGYEGVGPGPGSALWQQIADRFEVEPDVGGPSDAGDATDAGAAADVVVDVGADSGAGVDVREGPLFELAAESPVGPANVEIVETCGCGCSPAPRAPVGALGAVLALALSLSLRARKRSSAGCPIRAVGAAERV